MSPADRDRLLELILAQADGTLSPAEAAELARLGAGGAAEAERRLLAATELALIDLEAREAVPLPASLRDRLIAAGGAHFAGAGRGGVVANVDRGRDGLPAVVPGPIATYRREAPGGRPTVLARLGWVAAAAGLALAALAWWPARQPGPGAATGPLALQRQVDAAADAVRWPFAGKVDEFKAAGGEVVWSDALQRGYMRLKDLAANDPSRAQYQLWIVDPARSKEPVDGGVFDIAPGAAGEVIVPIDAKLAVRQPAAFAITREKPGGVVVSAGPLLVVAARG